MIHIFKTFFLLGWISFGGPAAHIGYFRQTFVEKLNWLSDEEYGQVVALSQFLPGPGSSQVGFALGYKRGGLLGAISAFIGFTSPSVILMLIFAFVATELTTSSLFQNIVHGLKLLAVVVVADAALGMYRSFCKQTATVTVCILTAIALLILPSVSMQIVVLLVAALFGAFYLKQDNGQQSSFKPSFTPLILFIVLLVGLPWIAAITPEINLFNQFYQAGSLVFGGGHVVLPLLQSLVGEQVSQDTFLTGYAAAQAVPGPMFTFATFIGFEMLPSNPVLGSLIATLAVFLPGFLLLLAVLKNWQALAQKPVVSGALMSVNAAVVGFLIAALYQPVFTSAVNNPLDIALVIAGFYAMKQLKLPILWLVLLFIFAGAMLGI